MVPEPRLGIQATIQVNETSIQIFSVDGVHNPTLNEPLHRWAAVATEHHVQEVEEIRRLEQEFQQDGSPFLLLCDCNLVDTSEFYRELSASAHDSFHEQGWGLGHTIPVQIGNISLPAGQRIDYIWRSEEFTVLKAWVGQNTGSSDHLPVLATLVLAPGQTSQSMKRTVENH